ncbi:4-hydroxybenzoate transporter PcaK [Serratia quinivorans]|uniref:MFS transporter n=1 Tax=Serratia quinivorans TaxID=137545 RepID=UPI0021777234|nr:aromatic acid/H+ symport family MFS transporter [Serratia quinivorans]CAI1496046.1 4-hydroxybenzoate transporter PcaK [Serratia quinivorans]
MTKLHAVEISVAVPIGRFHYGLLFWCSLIMLFDGYDLVVYGSVIPLLMEQWSLTHIQAGWMGSAALFGMMFGAVAIAPLADRVGRRKVILGAMTLTSLSVFANAFAGEPLSFTFLRFMTGVGLGGAVPNIVSLMSELAPRARRNRLITIMLSCYSIGAMLSALMAIVVIPALGWHTLFLIGGLLLLFLPSMYRYLPESLPFLVGRDNGAAVRLLKRIAPQEDTANILFEKQSTAESSPAFALLFKDGRGAGTLFIWLGFGMCMLLVYGLNTWLPKIMVNGGYPLGSSLMFLVTLNVGATLGALGGGWLADRFGSKSTLVLFFVLAALSLSALGTKPGPVLLNAMLLIAGATTIGTLAVIHAFAAQYYPSEIRSTAVGWCSAIGRFGGVAGPALGGLMLSLNLSFQLNFIFCSLPALIAIFAVAMVKRREPE